MSGCCLCAGDNEHAFDNGSSSRLGSSRCLRDFYNRRCIRVPSSVNYHIFGASVINIVTSGCVIIVDSFPMTSHWELPEELQSRVVIFWFPFLRL